MMFADPLQRLYFRVFTVLLLTTAAAAQVSRLAGQVPSAPVNGGRIEGTVKSGNAAIPGATVTATLGTQKLVGWTDINGHYSLHLPVSGHYTIQVQMTGFAPTARDLEVRPAEDAHLDINVTLLSHAQPSINRPTQNAAAARNGFRSLTLMQREGAAQNGSGISDPTSLPDMQVAGMNPDAATESVAIAGSSARSTMSSMSSEELQARLQEAREERQGFGGPGMLGGSFQGGQQGPGQGGHQGQADARGPGGGGGARGPGGGGGPMMLMGGRGRFDINRPHGMIYYTGGASGFDAAPYSLTGVSTPKPSFLQQRFGVAFGGPLIIPKIYNGGSKTFFFVNYNGARSDTPFSAFTTVPTLEQRAGNFSNTVIANGPNAGQPVQIFDPATHTQYPNNTLPAINSAAAGLLAFIPLPNLPGATQNFRFVTSTANDLDDFNLRLMHAFGSAPAMGRWRRGPRNNLTFGLHYHSTTESLTNQFPEIGGNTSIRSFDVPVGYIRSIGKLTNIARFDYNRNRISTQNLYAFAENVAGTLGITGVSQDPFDWGVPNISFSNFGGIQDTNPLLERDQTFTFSDFMVLNRGKHTWHWGGDFRRLQLNTETDSNGRGSFIFTGLNTAETVGGVPVVGTGYDFADFLLGLPQQTSVQFGQNNYHFRGNSWDLFVQDEWRVRGNLTLNLGLRYEYVSPFSETQNQLANISIAPGFTGVSVVLPGQAGLPTTLVKPDRNNFAPRIGIAWKALPNTVIRVGYGINYNTGAYQDVVQQLAFQPPFSFTQTNIQSPTTPLTLQSGFPPNPGQEVTNNYGVDPNYRFGYVQIWNLNIQQQMGSTVVLNLDYTGSKGTDLDIITAPNRTATGLLIPGVQPFLFETSQGDSILHAGSVRLRKRLQHGMSIGGTYTYSKSIDNASTIAGNTVIVAQDAFDLGAERGLSSFDQRHRFTADYLWQLPFGRDKRWLYQNGILQDLFGDWQWSGSWTIASGFPFTPRVLGSFTDVSRGTNGTLRADLTGQPISMGNPSVGEWFNTAAFVEPSSGTFGDAPRNSITGPGSRLFDMAVTKLVSISETRSLELRVQALNVFNTPQFTGIDTVVNSPTFGRVITVGQMRTLQLTGRFRY